MDLTITLGYHSHIIMVAFSKSAQLLALLLSAHQALQVASCDPPTSPSDVSHGYAATPDNTAAITDANKAAVRSFFSDHGCKTMGGDGSGSRCQYPGSDNVVHLDGWTIDHSFNPAACLPGSKCID